ncbi:MAG TPA: hypothetical protein VNI84_03980 [Pyrinomonadaceae bacterium]|nr:hypothetical protein [Pyrinomonadaceae bacterium]
MVTGARNFGLIEASGTAKDRKLLLRTLDATGKERRRHEIRQSELTFPES